MGQVIDKFWLRNYWPVCEMCRAQFQNLLTMIVGTPHLPDASAGEMCRVCEWKKNILKGRVGWRTSEVDDLVGKGNYIWDE